MVLCFSTSWSIGIATTEWIHLCVPTCTSLIRNSRLKALQAAKNPLNWIEFITMHFAGSHVPTNKKTLDINGSGCKGDVT